MPKFQIIIKTPAGEVNLVRCVQEEFNGIELTKFCKRICKKLGVAYKDAEIFISNYPEQKHKYLKSPGFTTLGAHG